MREKRAKIGKAALTAAVTGSVLAVPAVASAHFGDELLGKGMYNDDVKELQGVLKNQGFYKISKTTGYFGASTEKAVKRFQQSHGLKADGIVGPHTKGALNRYIPYDGQTMSVGMEGETVNELQKHLKQLHFYSGDIDGKYGMKTRLAVLRFQKDEGLKKDGIVGPDTFVAIHEAISTGFGPDQSPQIEKHQKPETPRLVKSAKAEPSADTENKAGETKTVSASEEKAPAVKKAAKSAAKVMYMNATAYTASCTGCSGVTAAGIDLNAHPDSKVVAVDPDVIPLGTKLYVEGYGYAVAGDTGGAIQGKRIDLFMPDRSDALDFGRQTVKVKILGE